MDDRGGEAPSASICLWGGRADAVPAAGRSGTWRAINTIMEAVLVVVLFGGFVAAMAAIVFLGRHLRPIPDFTFQPAQGHVIPHRSRAILFSRAERSFYQTLRAVVPDHMI